MKVNEDKINVSKLMIFMRIKIKKHHESGLNEKYALYSIDF